MQLPEITARVSLQVEELLGAQVVVVEITSTQLLHGQVIQETVEPAQPQGMQVVEAIAVQHPLILKTETLPREEMVAEPQEVVVVQAGQELDIQEAALLTQLHKHRMAVQVLFRV
jgi:hypothetical protein